MKIKNLISLLQTKDQDEDVQFIVSNKCRGDVVAMEWGSDDITLSVPKIVGGATPSNRTTDDQYQESKCNT